MSWEEEGPRDVCKVQLAHPEMHSLVQGVAQKAAKICLPPLCFSSSGYMIPSPSAMPRQLVCLGITCLLPLEEPIHPSYGRGDSPTLPRGAQQVKELVWEGELPTVKGSP